MLERVGGDLVGYSPREWGGNRTREGPVPIDDIRLEPFGGANCGYGHAILVILSEKRYSGLVVCHACPGRSGTDQRTGRRRSRTFAWRSAGRSGNRHLQESPPHATKSS